MGLVVKTWWQAEFSLNFSKILIIDLSDCDWENAAIHRVCMNHLHEKHHKTDKNQPQQNKNQHDGAYCFYIIICISG